MNHNRSKDIRGMIGLLFWYCFFVGMYPLGMFIGMMAAAGVIMVPLTWVMGADWDDGGVDMIKFSAMIMVLVGVPSFGLMMFHTGRL